MGKLTSEQLLEAIQDLKEMGFEVIPKDRGRIPDQDKQEIAEDLQYYKDSIKTRLQALDPQERESNFKEHELQSLEASLASIYCIQADLKEGQILDLFRHSVSLGCELLDGDGPHQYDAKRTFRKKREETGGLRRDIADFSKMKPYIFEKADQLWRKDPDALLKDVVEYITPMLEKKFRADKYPQKSTVRKWLKDAHESPVLNFTMPEHVMKGGRRPE